MKKIEYLAAVLAGLPLTASFSACAPLTLHENGKVVTIDKFAKPFNMDE